MPQMSPMYWTLLLIYIMMIMYIYMSLLYFNPMLNHYNKFNLKKFTKITMKLMF
uniref:ATP synthase F0 subunit 8 n=1 Tax=Lasioglossum fulvicorne TaxID=88508 RepID=A0A0S2LTE8_9HYME|nr:ATP synthase F0 subunit 8 [Lasioglossum fulvicorne]